MTPVWVARPGGPNGRRLDRLIVVAPHPDDEVLGAAGIMAWAERIGSELVVVAVTDGEASHRASTAITPAELVVMRAAERDAALGCLGVAPRLELLHLPDAGVADREDDLARVLADIGGFGSVMIVPYELDGHPDHEACSRAGRRAADLAGAELWQVPIWSRVRACFAPSAPVDRLQLGPAFRQAKNRAVRQYDSQLRCLGTSSLDGPVVSEAAVAALTQDTELVSVG